MEIKISINLQSQTFDMEIRGASLNHTNDLSTIGQAVADNLKANLLILGADPKKADEGVNLLLQGKYDIQDILRGCLGDWRSLCVNRVHVHQTPKS